MDDGGSLLYDGKYLYAITGGGGEESSGKGFYRLDLEEMKQWESLEELPCPVGYYVGNRLALVNGHIFAWQGANSKFDCNGTAIMRYEP